MEIIHEPSELTVDLSAGSCVTIGNFDGVHQGHRKLISRVVNKAANSGMASVVITFDPHPLRVLVGPNTPPHITFSRQKLDLFAGLDVDLTLMLRFTRELAALEPEAFVHRYLVDLLKTRHLVVGYDYTFGKGRKGNFQLLTELGRAHGFSVEQLEPVIINGAIVSSTRIRDMIQAGDVWNVRPLLGRFYAVRGTVIHGHNRGGKLLGFPTANLKLENEVHPKQGVYAIWAQMDDQFFPAVANIGYNPTFGNHELSVEAHILDFDQDIYERELRVHFVQFIRPERKFNGLDELKGRIAEDVNLARRILDSAEAKV